MEYGCFMTVLFRWCLICSPYSTCLFSGSKLVNSVVGAVNSLVCFWDEKLRYPGGGSYGIQRIRAKRFIEEYVSVSGRLPTGVHKICVRGYSGGNHDFSDL